MVPQVVQERAVEGGALGDAAPGVVDVALMGVSLLSRPPGIAGNARQRRQHLRWRRDIIERYFEDGVPVCFPVLDYDHRAAE